MSTATPVQVLESIVTGINSGDLESLVPLYESDAAFATQPGSLAHGVPGVREALSGFISLTGTLDLDVTRVLEVERPGHGDEAAQGLADAGHPVGEAPRLGGEGGVALV